MTALAIAPWPRGGHQFISFAFFVWIPRPDDSRQDLWLYLRLFGLPRPALKVYRHITFRLALQTRIVHCRQPLLGLAIIFKPAVLHRLVKTLTYIVKHDPRFFIARYGKPDAIATTVGGQVGTLPGITHIAEIAKLDFCWSDLIDASAAGTLEPSAQWQTSGKGPAKRNSFGGIEKGTRHNGQILTPKILGVKINLSLHETCTRFCAECQMKYATLRNSPLHMLDFCNDRAQPPSDACPIPGTKSR